MMRCRDPLSRFLEEQGHKLMEKIEELDPTWIWNNLPVKIERSAICERHKLNDDVSRRQDCPVDVHHYIRPRYAKQDPLV
jgi:hypothetical protein